MSHKAMSLLLLTVIVSSGTAIADDTGKPHLTGDWGGVRTDLEQSGVDFELNYTSEIAYNATGGAKDAVRYTDQWALSGSFDLERLRNIHDAEVQLTITDRNGRNLSDDAHLGTLQQVQEVFGRGQTWRLTQFWYDQKYFSDALDWKIGRLTMGEDFAAFSCQFQNLTFCGSQPGNIVGDYWFNWPVSQWASRVKFNVDDAVSIQVGAYQVNPGFLETEDAVLPNNPSGTTGVMVPFEVEWSPQVGEERLPGSYKFGIWYDTSKANDVFDDTNGDPAVLTGLPFEQRHGRYGAYVNFKQQVARFDIDDPARGLSLFLNATF